MAWTPDNLSVKGALASFHQGMEAGPTIWDKHAMTVQSNTDIEAHSFPGMLPKPKEFLDSRQFQGMRDFRYNVTNKEYELSLLTTRKNWEDDQTGLINSRYAETGECWKSFKDDLFSTLLTNGNVSTNNGFDGTTFHSNSHASGTTALVADNNIDADIVATSVITAAEALTTIAAMRSAFLLFIDDQSRPYNTQAVTNLRFIVPTGHERGFYEAMNQTSFTGGSGATNEWGNYALSGLDVNPYLTTGTEAYVSALGSTRKPFIYQERTPLEVIVLSSADEVAKNNGVMLLTRQRFVLTYGDFRRNILITFI